MPEWLKLIVSTLPGIATAIIAAYLASKYSIQRLYEEKWWDRKVQAYTDIIDALSHLVQCCDRLSEHPGHVDLPKYLDEGYSTAYQKLENATTIGAFIISEEAAKILAELERRPKIDYECAEPDEVAAQELGYYITALAGIRECARKDLHR